MFQAKWPDRTRCPAAPEANESPAVSAQATPYVTVILGIHPSSAPHTLEGLGRYGRVADGVVMLVGPRKCGNRLVSTPLAARHSL
jgi:hypothetical protein